MIDALHMGTGKKPLKIILARPRGFCAGVVRAIDIVERSLAIHGAPVYVRHEIVHNKHVVMGLQAQGAVFVSEVDAIPHGAVTIFSAHGVSPTVHAKAALRNLDVIDATCPLVEKVHKEGRRYAERGYDVVLIGHAGHPEVEGTRGQIAGRLHVIAHAQDVAALDVLDDTQVAYITQTTLSLIDTAEVIAALKQRFPEIIGQDTRDICYATQNRQNAVLQMAGQVDLLLVVGSRNSSNSSRLAEIGERSGLPSYLIDDAAMLNPAWFDGVDTVGLTAGASAPEYLVQAAIVQISQWRAVETHLLDGEEEAVQFRLPPRLQERAIVTF